MIWSILGGILGFIIGIIVIMFFVFLFSRIQMKAWLQEVESFLNDKFHNSKINQNEKTTQE